MGDTWSAGLSAVVTGSAEPRWSRATLPLRVLHIRIATLEDTSLHSFGSLCLIFITGLLQICGNEKTCSSGLECLERPSFLKRLIRRSDSDYEKAWKIAPFEQTNTKKTADQVSWASS